MAHVGIGIKRVRLTDHRDLGLGLEWRGIKREGRLIQGISQRDCIM